MSDDPAPPRHLLTREFLRASGFAEMVARTLPAALLMSETDRQASLHATLAARPDPGPGVWLFAYGSLIWNPTFHFTDRKVARIDGWHRAFCLAARGGRGTPANPALLLGLMPGGTCTGVAFHIAEEAVEPELDLVWRREMVTAAYVPHWTPMRDADERPLGPAITFTINPDAPTYAGELPPEDVARRIAAAQGPMGTCTEYVLHTRDSLHALGITDPLVDDIARRVGQA